MDLPVAIVDVDRVLEQDRRARPGSSRPGGRAAPPGTRSCAPSPAPAGRATSRRSARRTRAASRPGTRRSARCTQGRAGPARRIATPYSIASTVQAGLGRDRRRVQVAVDVLGDPVGRERRAEPAEHVVAGQPPAPDVVEHGAQRMRAVQVVEDPEEVAARVSDAHSIGKSSSPRNWSRTCSSLESPDRHAPVSSVRSSMIAHDCVRCAEQPERSVYDFDAPPRLAPTSWPAAGRQGREPGGDGARARPARAARASRSPPRRAARTSPGTWPAGLDEELRAAHRRGSASGSGAVSAMRPIRCWSASGRARRCRCPG